MITLGKAIDISNEKIATLDAAFAMKVMKWYSNMTEVMPYLMIYFGYRSFEEQQKIYDSGVRPCAPPGKSFHNFKQAIDWCPLKGIPGMPDYWEADWDCEGPYKLGEEIGLKYGLRHLESETGHLENADFATYREAKEYYLKNLWP
jgi:hypothetical protein